jgi:hypothetical membrane protein
VSSTKVSGIWVKRPAFLAALVASVQCWLGWTIAGSLWTGYDPVRQTISDLAANESPVKYLMSAFFLLGGTLSIIGALNLPALSMPGRLAIFVSGVATYGLTIFPTPLIGYSVAHRVFAITSFVLSSAWPLLSMRFDRSYPWIIRPAAALVSTAFFTVLSIYFLKVWTDPHFMYVGVVERVLVVAQAWYLVAVVVVLHLKQRVIERAPHAL